MEKPGHGNGELAPTVKDPPLNEKRQTAALENPQSFGKLSTTNICNDTQNTPTQLQHSQKSVHFLLPSEQVAPAGSIAWLGIIRAWMSLSFWSGISLAGVTATVRIALEKIDAFIYECICPSVYQRYGKA